MPSLVENFAVNFEATRQRRGLTQEALAEKAKVSVSYISMLSRGRRSPPLDTLESLARALEVTPADLLREPRKKV